MQHAITSKINVESVELLHSQKSDQGIDARYSFRADTKLTKRLLQTNPLDVCSETPRLKGYQCQNEWRDVASFPDDFLTTIPSDVTNGSKCVWAWNGSDKTLLTSQQVLCNIKDSNIFWLFLYSAGR